jgi:dipeptidase E
VTKLILAIGGGGFLMEEAPSPIDRFVAQLPGRERPKVCFISTASGDEFGGIDKFYTAYAALGCEASHLAFFRKPFRASLPLAGFAEPLLSHDVIFIGGGNTKSALAVWREWGLDKVLAEAWRRGVVLAGMSAGAMCWFDEGLTDSYWGAGLKPLACLGFLPGGCAVHYSSDPKRRSHLHEEVRAGAAGPRLAIDDGAAVLFSDTSVREVVSWQPQATAYQVGVEGGEVVEQAYAARPVM